ncbi:unnamed protein product [Gadus morhua 'NCC']
MKRIGKIEGAEKGESSWRSPLEFPHPTHPATHPPTTHTTAAAAAASRRLVFTRGPPGGQAVLSAGTGSRTPDHCCVRLLDTAGSASSERSPAMHRSSQENTGCSSQRDEALEDNAAYRLLIVRVANSLSFARFRPYFLAYHLFYDSPAPDTQSALLRAYAFCLSITAALSSRRHRTTPHALCCSTPPCVCPRARDLSAGVATGVYSFRHLPTSEPVQRRASRQLPSPTCPLVPYQTPPRLDPPQQRPLPMNSATSNTPSLHRDPTISTPTARHHHQTRQPTPDSMSLPPPAPPPAHMPNTAACLTGPEPASAGWWVPPSAPLCPLPPTRPATLSPPPHWHHPGPPVSSAQPVGRPRHRTSGHHPQLIRASAPAAASPTIVLSLLALPGSNWRPYPRARASRGPPLGPRIAASQPPADPEASTDLIERSLYSQATLESSQRSQRRARHNIDANIDRSFPSCAQYTRKC